MNIVRENINFKRGGDPLDKIRVGKSYSPKTLEVDGLYSTKFVALNSGGNEITDPYDVKKFLQNVQNGFYPCNFYLKPNEFTDLIPSDELLERGYTGILFKGKYYKLG